MRLPEFDIHTHILPGVDDGFAKAEDSVSALKCMWDAGVRQVYLTPHINPDVFPKTDESLVKSLYEDFMKSLPTEGIPSVALAAEYMVTKDFETRAEDTDLLCYPDGSVLIEMSYYYPSPNLEQTIFELSVSGRKPILAHPERYRYLADSLKLFDHYADMGCRFQGNLMSMTGAYGPESVRIAKYLLEKNLYSFLASDLHSNQQLGYIMGSEIHNSLKRRLKNSTLLPQDTRKPFLKLF